MSAEQEAIFRRRRLTREHMDGEIESPPVHMKPSGTSWAAQTAANEALKPRQNKRVSRRISRELDEKDTVVWEEREQPFFPKLGVLGTFSAHGIEPGEDEGSGAIAKINQDCGCVCYPFAEDDELALLLVMDGHGPEGEKVSNSLMHALVRHLETSALLQSKPAAALEESFEAAHQALLTGVKTGDVANVGDPGHSGATALAILLRPTAITVAHAGDCRAVLGVAVKVDKSPGAAIDLKKVRAWDLNAEHKPDGVREQPRVEEAGGFVRQKRWDDGIELPARLYYSATARGPGLAVSRSLGDVLAHSAGLSHAAEVTQWTLSDGAALPSAAAPSFCECLFDEALEAPQPLCPAAEALFIILGSDGLWELLESQTAADLVMPLWREGGTAMDAAEMLIAESARRWKIEEGDYRDDITAIVVFLPCFGEPDTTSRRLPSREPSMKKRDSGIASSARSRDAAATDGGFVPSMAMERGDVAKEAKGAELTGKAVAADSPADDEAPAAGGCCGLFAQKSSRKVAPAPALA